MNKLYILAAVAGVVAISFAAPADAQQINTKAREKVRWYNAPHEIQILDESPIVKDFREAPAAGQTLDLPPGPAGTMNFGQGGPGALGGGNNVLPAGGLPLGNGSGPGYRLQQPNGLPRADFGHAQSNIPARGMGPRGALPMGTTTGVHAKVAPMNKPTPTMGTRGGSPVARQAAPVAQSYGGGYGPVTGGSGVGSSSTSTDVRAKLLNRVK